MFPCHVLIDPFDAFNTNISIDYVVFVRTHAAVSNALIVEVRNSIGDSFGPGRWNAFVQGGKDEATMVVVGAR